METITKSASETKKLGKSFAANLKGGEILALSGELGSGKTTFVQGVADGLEVGSWIVSPTFILMRKYDISFGNLYHLDLYRLEDNVESEVRNLGVEDIWGKKENFVVIEWAEKIKKMLPKKTTWIEFDNLGGDKRKIVVKS